MAPGITTPGSRAIAFETLWEAGTSIRPPNNPEFRQSIKVSKLVEGSGIVGKTVLGLAGTQGISIELVAAFGGDSLQQPFCFSTTNRALLAEE